MFKKVGIIFIALVGIFVVTQTAQADSGLYVNIGRQHCHPTYIYTSYPYYYRTAYVYPRFYSHPTVLHDIRYRPTVVYYRMPRYPIVVRSCVPQQSQFRVEYRRH